MENKKTFRKLVSKKLDELNDLRKQLEDNKISIEDMSKKVSEIIQDASEIITNYFKEQIAISKNEEKKAKLEKKLVEEHERLEMFKCMILLLFLQIPSIYLFEKD